MLLLPEPGFISNNAKPVLLHGIISEVFKSTQLQFRGFINLNEKTDTNLLKTLHLVDASARLSEATTPEHIQAALDGGCRKFRSVPELDIFETLFLENNKKPLMVTSKGVDLLDVNVTAVESAFLLFGWIRKIFVTFGDENDLSEDFADDIIDMCRKNAVEWLGFMQVRDNDDATLQAYMSLLRSIVRRPNDWSPILKHFSIGQLLGQSYPPHEGS